MKILIDNGHGAETPGNGSEKRPGKMVVSLLNVERETAGGISAISYASCPLFSVQNRKFGQNID